MMRVADQIQPTWEPTLWDIYPTNNCSGYCNGILKEREKIYMKGKNKTKDWNLVHEPKQLKVGSRVKFLDITMGGINIPERWLTGQSDLICTSHHLITFLL